MNAEAPPPHDPTFRLDHERAAWRQVGDEFVVLDLTTSSYLSINETGAALWPLLEAGAGRAELITAILDRFEVDADTATTDVDSFLGDLGDRGLLITD